MANEELIYRITRAIYDRLGSSADEATVEQLVTDIYRSVEPSLAISVAPAPGASALGNTGVPPAGILAVGNIAYTGAAAGTPADSSGRAPPAAVSSTMLWNRSAGAFARQRSTKASTLGGIPGARDDGADAGSRMCAAMMSPGASPSNGGRPVSR